MASQTLKEPSQKEEKCTKAAKAYARWREYSANYRATVIKCPADSTPWTGRPDVKLHGIPEHWLRVHELLDCFAEKALADARKDALRAKAQGKPFHYDELEIMRGLQVDVSQAIQRGFNGGRPTCLAQSTFLYIYKYDLLLPGLAHPLISGFPRGLDFTCGGTGQPKRARGMNEYDRASRNARRLVWESYSLPAAAVAHMSLFLVTAAPWWH